MFHIHAGQKGGETRAVVQTLAQRRITLYEELRAFPRFNRGVKRRNAASSVIRFQRTYVDVHAAKTSVKQ